LFFDKRALGYLQVSLRALGFPVKKSEVADLLKKRVDEGHDRLDYETFKSVVSEKLCERTFQASSANLQSTTSIMPWFSILVQKCERVIDTVIVHSDIVNLISIKCPHVNKATKNRPYFGTLA
jgi:hypothetical protein